MARRSEQRRAAAFALYQSEVTGRPLEDTLPRDASLFTRSLAYAAEDRNGNVEQTAAATDGQSVTIRYKDGEKKFMVPADTPIPPEGAIEEAVKTAKTYAAAQAAGFVNGILAAVLRETRQNQPR